MEQRGVGDEQQEPEPQDDLGDAHRLVVGGGFAGRVGEHPSTQGCCPCGQAGADLRAFVAGQAQSGAQVDEFGDAQPFTELTEGQTQLQAALSVEARMPRTSLFDLLQP